MHQGAVKGGDIDSWFMGIYIYIYISWKVASNRRCLDWFIYIYGGVQNQRVYIYIYIAFEYRDRLDVGGL